MWPCLIVSVQHIHFPGKVLSKKILPWYSSLVLFLKSSGSSYDLMGTVHCLIARTLYFWCIQEVILSTFVTCALLNNVCLICRNAACQCKANQGWRYYWWWYSQHLRKAIFRCYFLWFITLKSFKGCEDGVVFLLSLVTA